jgi:hypothetical protein
MNNSTNHSAHWHNQGEANWQLPISSEDLPIAISISKLLPIENIEIIYRNEFSSF